MTALTPEQKRERLAREVHAAWRDGMLAQGRQVAPERMQWDTLSPEDRELDVYIVGRVQAALVPTAAQVLFVERAEYRDPGKEVSLVGRIGDDGLRIGCQALEPWYGTGVLIPPGHSAYAAGVAFLAALAPTEVHP